MKKGTRNYVGAILLAWCESIGMVYTLVWLHWHSTNKSSRLLLEALPCNIGVTSMVCLLSSYHSKGNMSLGAFDHLEIDLYCLCGLFCNFWVFLLHLF